MRIYSIKVRNPLVAALLVIVALGALAMAFMVGVILLATVAVAGLLLAAGLVIRRKLGRLRGELPHSPTASARLDPSMEVRADPRRIEHADSAPPDPE